MMDEFILSISIDFLFLSMVSDINEIDKAVLSKRFGYSIKSNINGSKKIDEDISSKLEETVSVVKRLIGCSVPLV